MAAGGGKWPAPLPLSIYVGVLHADHIRDFRGFDRPWRLLAPSLEEFRVTEVSFDCGYVAVGRVPSGTVTP